MARKKYACDFETTTIIDDCRVWAYGYMEIGNKTNYRIGNSFTEFMEFVKTSQTDLYFHNLKFDGSFIINWLMKNGFEYSKDGLPNTFNVIISNMGQWYMIDICYGYKGKKKIHTAIYDSLKKLPFTISKIAKDFNMEILKGEIDYHKERPVGHEITDREYKYIKHDIEILANALEIQFNQGLTRMTTGSDSLADYKSVLSHKYFKKYFPILSLPLNENIRLFYKGGFTWLNDKYENKDIEEGIVFDVNSLYPSQMYDKDLPYGIPIYFDGEYKEDKQYPLYLQHIRCSFEIKKDKIPTIQIKKNLMYRPNEYLKSSDGDIVDLYLTNIDLDIVKEHYSLYDLSYMGGWKFKKKKGLFNKFIDKWTYVKVNNTGAIRLLAKLMLNSLYGKFATNPNVTGKVPYLKEDGSNGFTVGEEEFKDPVYTPMGVFITAYAREVTIRTAQKVYNRIIYCDTDSIHLTGTEIPDEIKDIVDPNKLGYWDFEGSFKRARYIRQKTYVQELYTDDTKEETYLSVKCCGMNDIVKSKVTFDNFKKGFKAMGSLKPKQVNGGVVLIDSEFTIK